MISTKAALFRIPGHHHREVLHHRVHAVGGGNQGRQSPGRAVTLWKASPFFVRGCGPVMG